MSPRPRIRHSAAEGRLFSLLHRTVGSTGAGSAPPEWFFAVEPEIRAERLFSRVVPDLAAWNRESTGWPDLDRTPVELVPDWVAEVLSPTTESIDRGRKRELYGALGVGWLWLVDADRRLVETFRNVKGQMVADRVLGADEPLDAEPFGALGERVAELFVPEPSAQP